MNEDGFLMDEALCMRLDATWMRVDEDGCLMDEDGCLMDEEGCFMDKTDASWRKTYVYIIYALWRMHALWMET